MPTSSYNKFQAFVERINEAVMNLQGDSLKVFLCAAANAPVATNSNLADLTEISYANLSTRVLTVTSSAQSSGVYKLIIQDLTLLASGGSVATFRYIGI